MTPAVCAIASIRNMPGRMGLVGKVPPQRRFLGSIHFTATQRTPGSSSSTRSIHRNGARCGITFQYPIRSITLGLYTSNVPAGIFVFSDVISILNTLFHAARAVHLQRSQQKLRRVQLDTIWLILRRKPSRPRRQLHHVRAGFPAQRDSEILPPGCQRSCHG